MFIGCIFSINIKFAIFKHAEKQHIKKKKLYCPLYGMSMYNCALHWNHPPLVFGMLV